MPMSKAEIQNEMNEAWNTYVEALEKSLDMIENDIEEAEDMAGVCNHKATFITKTRNFESTKSLVLFSYFRYFGLS